MKTDWTRTDIVLVVWVVALSVLALVNPAIPRIGVVCIMLSAIVIAAAWRFYPQRRDASIALAFVALAVVSAPTGLFIAVPAALLYGLVALVLRR